MPGINKPLIANTKSKDTVVLFRTMCGLCINLISLGCGHVCRGGPPWPPLVPIQAPRKLTEGVATEGRPYNCSEPAAFRTSVIDAEVFPYLFDGPTLPKPINVFSGGQ